MIDGMNVGHGVFDHSPNLFQAFVRSHGTNRVSLDEDVALCQKLQSFQSRAVGPKDSLPAFDEALLVSDKVTNLDNVRGNTILKYFHSLRSRNASREELDKISCIEYGSGIVSFSSCSDRHASFDQIQGASNMMSIKGTGDQRPYEVIRLDRLFTSLKGV